MFPRNRAANLHAVRQLVEHDVLHVRIVLHDEPDIVEVVFQYTVLIALQTFLPLVIDRFRKVFFCLTQSLVCRHDLDLILPHGKIAHGAEGCLIIQITELVDADDIEGITEFQICRVFRMVGIDKLFILDLHARNAAGSDEMPAAFALGRLVYAGKKGFKSTGDRKEYPVEDPDCAFFFKRILHLLLRDLIRLALTRGCGKPRRIRPFRVRRQDRIRVEPFLFHFFEDKYAVLRRRRPVHQLIRPIGAFIEKVNAQHLRQIPGYCHELLRGDIPQQREYQSYARIRLRTGMRGVKA